nr:MAG TPA: hypothetical protein [Caudoviricetes sp.]
MRNIQQCAGWLSSEGLHVCIRTDRNQISNFRQQLFAKLI